MPQSNPPANGASTAQAGFTLIELAVGMVIFGLVAALSTSGWFSYQRSAAHRGTAQELVSALRSAQQSALAEAVTHCVALSTSTRSWTIHKYGCPPGAGSTVVKSATKTQSGRITLDAPAFLQTDGNTLPQVSFFPRGSATKGSVRVLRAGSAKAYTINVEGLTGRVSLTG